jgi:hypothetical protein
MKRAWLARQASSGCVAARLGRPAWHRAVPDSVVVPIDKTK